MKRANFPVLLLPLSISIGLSAAALKLLHDPVARFFAVAGFATSLQLVALVFAAWFILITERKPGDRIDMLFGSVALSGAGAGKSTLRFVPTLPPRIGVRFAK